MSQEASQTLDGSFQSKFTHFIPVIVEGDPAPPESLDVVQCKAISVLGRYVDATSSTPFYNCHGRQDCLNPYKQSGKFPNHLKRTL